jgi:hypothetical protein
MTDKKMPSEREELIGIIEASDMNMNNDEVIQQEIDALADAILEWHKKGLIEEIANAVWHKDYMKWMVWVSGRIAELHERGE